MVWLSEAFGEAGILFREGRNEAHGLVWVVHNMIFGWARKNRLARKIISRSVSLIGSRLYKRVD